MTGPCEAEAIRRGEPEWVRNDAKRIDAMVERVDDVIARLDRVVSRLETMSPERRAELLSGT